MANERTYSYINAGSGKSTLMKLIIEHHKTRQALRLWADGTKLVCPSFYFWYGGTQMQRSQLGMLRALIHELILINEALVPVVFPYWKQQDAETEPEGPELMAALRTILDADSRQICFFIDGLDEYEGNSIRFAEYIDQLARLEKYSANIKFVVSSRPLQELQRHIYAEPHLMLQDLTYNDISTYAKNKLQKNNLSRASGVFLWVYIVVQSLLDGLENHDSLAELMAMLLKLPTELDELYSVMFQRISRQYQAQAHHQHQVSESAEDGYDVNVAILGALAITSGTPLCRVEKFSQFVRRAERSTGRAQSAAVELFDHNLFKDAKTTDRFKVYRNGEAEGSHWSNHLVKRHIRPCAWHDTTLSFAIRCGWDPYVLDALRKHGKGLPAKQGRPLLDYAVEPDPPYTPFAQGISHVIVRALLEHGADPNGLFAGETHWSKLLYLVKDLPSLTQASRRIHEDGTSMFSTQQAVADLLEFGADLEATCKWSRKNSKGKYIEETTSGRDIVHNL
ncbi:putative P-loop containing nucleoside triphosphate hydrolase [Septoria linicola]|nr:putative P-loop containing nucleoside triphosphate hydrolase [Septoria linicola]